MSAEEEAAKAAMKDEDRLGRLLIRALAGPGGLAGIVIAALQLLGSRIGSSSSHIPGGWSDLVQRGRNKPMFDFAASRLRVKPDPCESHAKPRRREER